MNSIFYQWHFDPAIILFVALLSLLYGYAINFKLKKQSVYFFAGIFVILLCMASPLHFIGHHYLFSAHMLSHVLLLLIAAPLLVAGIPEENKFQKGLLFFSKKIKQIPVLGWFAGVVVMWFWHIPFIFNQLTSMNGMYLMYVQLISLLIGGIIFSWPIINPYKEDRIAPITGVLYLSTACVFCSILGLMITFAPPGTFTGYINMPDSFGYLPMMRNGWNISAAADQQAAGLIMWVPCCFIYLTASMLLLIKWFETGRDTQAGVIAETKFIL